MSIDREAPRRPSATGRGAPSRGGPPMPGPAPAPSDGFLAALRAGDPAVLPVLLEEHGRELGGVAFLILRDLAEAEEVVVDTLLIALDRGAELRDAATLRGWLLRIATQRALARLRRRRRVVAIEVVDEPVGGFGEPTHLATRATVSNAVSRLPPRERAAVVLHGYAGCPEAEVAAILGPPSTGTSELRTALDRLRAELGSKAELDPGVASAAAGGAAVPTQPDPLVGLLGRILREAVLAVEIPPERVVAAYAERRRRAARRRSVAVVAVAAVLLGGLLGALSGTGARHTVPTPAPSGGPTTAATPPRPTRPPSLTPSAIPAPPSLPALPSGKVAIDLAEAGSPTGTVARRWVGDVGLAASYGVAWVCSGPGSFAYAIGEEGTKRLVAAPGATPCDGRPRLATFQVQAAGNPPVYVTPVYVTVDRRAAWRLVVTRDPLAFSEPTPAATGRASLDTPGAGVVVYARTYRGAPLLVVDVVGPDGDRGRVAEYHVTTVFGAADEVSALVEAVRFDGARYLTVPIQGKFVEPRNSGTVTITDRYAILVYDLRAPGRPPRVLVDTSAAWGPDGRLAYFVGRTLRLLDPDGGVESTVPIPEGVALGEGGLGDGSWLADGSGFSTARWDPGREEWIPGVLAIDGTFRALAGPTPPTFSPTGLPRRPAHGGVVGPDCPEHPPGGACGIAVSFGPGEAPVRWWDRSGLTEWTADGRAIWVVEDVDEPGPSADARLVRVAGPGHAEVVAAWESPHPDAFPFVAAIAADDSAVLVAYADPLPELRWIDVAARTVRRIPGSFAGWVRP
jgi:DNA-directed RNA polymerase specialized sigma24 family protein